MTINIDIGNYRRRIQHLEKLLSSPDFMKMEREDRIKLLKEEKHIRRILEDSSKLKDVDENIAAAEELLLEDEKLSYIKERERVYRGLLVKLLPEEKEAERDLLIEIKGGEGGNESELFAGDLLKMYLRYAEHRGWEHKIQEIQEGSVGGYRYVNFTVRRGSSSIENSPWLRLRQEFGVHRVQRVPATESQGRIHTSAAAVYVMPILDGSDDDVQIKAGELRVDTYRASGPGGQSVNTTDSAVRITHLPTGISASSQNERSQLQNKESAMKLLKSKVAQRFREESTKNILEMRNSSVANVDRSQKIRSYNFPENRISDHRSMIKLYRLDEVMAGNLDLIVEPYIEWSLKEYLNAA